MPKKWRGRASSPGTGALPPALWRQHSQLQFRRNRSGEEDVQLLTIHLHTSQYRQKRSGGRSHLEHETRLLSLQLTDSCVKDQANRQGNLLWRNLRQSAQDGVRVHESRRPQPSRTFSGAVVDFPAHSRDCDDSLAPSRSFSARSERIRAVPPPGTTPPGSFATRSCRFPSDPLPPGIRCHRSARRRESIGGPPPVGCWLSAVAASSRDPVQPPRIAPASRSGH